MVNSDIQAPMEYPPSIYTDLINKTYYELHS